MPPEPAIDLAAIVGGEERDTIVAAARRLSHCLGEDDSGWPVRVHLGTAEAPPPGPSAIVIASLRADADLLEAPLDAIVARWPPRLAMLREGGHGAILMPTLFRHVADPAARPALVERIRRLNLIAVALSRTHGVQIVDVDRAFALVGARALATDYRGHGPIARDVAAHAIVAAILATGLDAQVSAERQERARARNGGRETVAAILARHGREAA